MTKEELDFKKPLLLPEPRLFFGGNNSNIDPKVGLLNYGPNGPYGTGEIGTLILKIGVIGTPASIYTCKQFLKYLENPIAGKIDKKSNVYSIDFPGISAKSPLKFELKINHSRIEEIPQSEIQALERIDSLEDRILKAVDIYKQKFQDLEESTEPVDVVLLPLSEQLIRLCKNPLHKQDKIVFARRTFDPDEDIDKVPLFDFHNILKVLSFKHGMITQVVQPRTMKFKRGTQDPATLAWNFSVAMYYKGTGIPWKLADLEEDTVYVGISFYEEIAEEVRNMRTAMAHIYLKTGESQVIRGKPFKWDTEEGKSPVLTRDQAKEILNDVIDLFNRQKKRIPRRVVVHKSSPFADQELEGFHSASSNIELKDFVHVHSRSSIRFFPKGDYSQVRGTFYGKDDFYLLYTTGFIPVYDTYPGNRIAEPLNLTLYNVDTTPDQVATDILSLSKLDWNSADFCKRLPVTLLVSRKVGSILSEIRDKAIKPPLSYRNYM
ncbi:MAG: Piwi domain-containing protein [Candidatus Odinarchaeota archaeon]